jgi:phosphoglycolate phosphatase-like HAD superfamily hydrolase
MPYDAVVFDFDGVIMDLPDESFEDHMTDVAERTLERYKMKPEHPAYRPLYDAICSRDMDRLEAAAATYGMDHERVWETKEAVSFERQRNQIDAGKRRFYDDIAALPELADYCDLGVFSNNQHDLIAYAMDQHAPQLNGTGTLDNVMTAYYGIQPTVDDHFNRKPEPAYIEQIQEDLEAENVLYVGDKAADITAAHRAGADSAFIQRPHTGDIPTDGEGVKPTYGPITDLGELTDIVATGEKP